MCIKKLATAAVLVATIVPVLAYAGSKHDNVPEKVKATHCAVGKWKVKGTLQAGEDKFPIQGKMHCDVISGGFGVMCKTTLTGIPGMDKYEETDIWGYDAHSDTYHMYSVTNGGETHDHAGKMSDDGWKGTYAATVDGQAYVENIDFRFTGDDSARITSVVTLGGKQMSALTANMER